MPNTIMQKAGSPPAPRPTPWFFPIVVLLASLTVTFFLWNLSFTETQHLAKTRLNEQALEITGQILKRLEENETILLGGNAVFAVRGDALTRQEWQQYATSLKLESNNPGILGFGFACWVQRSQLETHLRAIRGEGFPDYRIKPAGDRSFYSAITWIEPFNEINRRAFGYDMYSEPVRQAALNRARDTGTTSISNHVILVQEGEHEAQNGILMCVPSYRNGMPVDTIEQRQAALRGFIFSPIRMDDFVHAALTNMPEHLDIAIYCGQEAAPEHLLFSNRPAKSLALAANNQPFFTASRAIEVYGTTWYLTFTGRPSYEQQFDKTKSRTIFFIGMFASLLLTTLAWLQTRSQQQAFVIARQAEGELLSQQKFVLHIDQTPLAVIEWNTQLQVTAWNRAAENIFGYSSAEMLGAHLSLLFAADERETLTTLLSILLSTKQNDTGKFANLTKDGRTIVCEWYSATFSDQQGRVLGAATLAHDVTAANDAEEQLRTERNLLFSVMNGTRNVHLVYLDRDFNFIHVNQCYAASCGYQPEDMVGKNHFTLYPNDENMAIFKRVRDSGEPFEVHDKPFEFPDQPERGMTWWDWTLTPFKNWTGEVIGLVFSLIETTDRKKAEQTLKASEAQFRLLFEQHSAIMLLIDPATGRILNANEAAAEFYGYPRATLRRLNIEAINTLTQEEIRAILQEVRENRKKHFVTVHRLANGSIRNVDVYVSSICIDERRLNFAIIHDITDRVQAEAERDRLEALNQQLQKAESLSRMAGAIAHHINNQLQAVMISQELLHDSTEKRPESAETGWVIATAIEATEKASEISNLLLTYLAKVPVTFETIDLSNVCRKTLVIWQSSKPVNVDFDIHLPNDGPVIDADASQIQQMMTNLMINAWEGCEDRQGSVSLTLSTCEQEDIPSASRYPVDFQPTSRKYACIEIADTGCGIPQEFFDKLFDPFYSTKFTGRGMGLPVVLGIVRAHKGGIVVESQIGHGSVFRVYLPIIEQTLPKKASPIPPSKQLLGHGTILVVEDVQIIRSVVAAMLESLGFTVLQAEDGVQALELFDQHPKDILCVISDIVMPRMNGWETLEALRRRSPGIPVIFASGYAEEQLLEEYHSEMPDIYLEKPFQFAKLREALASILSRLGTDGSLQG
jgi:PAS domain S-box-containing protein